MSKEIAYKAYVAAEPYSASVVLTTRSLTPDVSLQTIPIPDTYTSTFSVESRPAEGNPEFYEVTTTTVKEEIQVYPSIDTAIARKRLAFAAKRIGDFSLAVPITAVVSGLAEVLPSLSEKQFAWQWAVVTLAGLSGIFSSKFLPDSEKTKEQLESLKAHKNNHHQPKIPSQRRAVHDALPSCVAPVQA